LEETLVVTTNAMPLPAPALAAVVTLTRDPLTATQLSNGIEAQGGRAIVVETPAAFVDAVDEHFPVLALVDLATPGDWPSAIARIKLRPHTRQIPLYGFGLVAEALQAARQAGVDQAWTRERLLQELPSLVQRHLHPPTRYPAGWDEPLSELALAGVAAFNQGKYFEQHEHFEHAWQAEARPIRELYQGILQVGVAFYQIQQGNWAGALKLFRRGLPRLRDLPPVCQGIQLDRFRTSAEAIHAEITALGPARLAEFDQRRFPKLELTSK
jgi:tetratricopeptide (TPR) repeat protein